MTVVRLKHCFVEYTPWGCLTHFPQSLTGAKAPGMPHPDDHHYHVISHRCGYGDDLLAYAREHDVAHSIVGQWFTDSVSDVLWCQAHKLTVDPAGAVLEEIAAQTLQRWIRAAEEPIVSNVDWRGLKEFALGVLDGSAG